MSSIPAASPFPDPAGTAPASGTSASAAAGTTAAAAATEKKARMPWSSILKNVALALAIIAGLWLVFNVRLPSMDALQSEIAELGGWGYAFFVVLYSAVAATPIPVTIMALVGGMAFGLPIGTALSMVGVVIGSSIGYWIARALGKETVMRLLGQHAATVEERLKDGGFYAVSLLRLMPGFPYWPVNYGSGAFGISSRPFLTATIVSSIPGQISLVAVGAFIGEPNIPNGIAVVLAWIVVIGLTIVTFVKLKKVHRAEVAAEKPSTAESTSGASAHDAPADDAAASPESSATDAD